MKYYHFKNRSERYEVGSRDKFVGTVHLEKFDDAPQSPELRAVFVDFKLGSYTKLHHHSGDQLLYVVQGQGFIEFEDGREIRLEPEVRVIIPAGVLHRHGADAEAEENLVHLAVTQGETFWWTADPGRSGYGGEE